MAPLFTPPMLIWIWQLQLVYNQQGVNSGEANIGFQSWSKLKFQYKILKFVPYTQGRP